MTKSNGAKYVAVDGNEAAAYVAYRCSEVIAIYPITPSSPMGEFADQWKAERVPNLWGTIPDVVEMQSEAGAAGAIHGALQTGALSTTFTASQGLLLMIPNMFKISGELTPTVFHIAARSVATHALSIFGDHSDVMAARSTGWAMLFSNSVQEAMDMAMVAHAATLKSRVPVLHAFDGFRTSHEVQKISQLPDEVIRAMISDDLVRQHRSRALDPERPVVRGTAHNPDTFFQARERCNPFYDAVPEVFEETMAQFAALTGRAYQLFEYVGAPDAERVIILSGSGCEIVEETVKALCAKGEKVGMVKVRLYRPFSLRHFLAVLPSTVSRIAVLDRTKEPGCAGEPLYQDVITCLARAQMENTLPTAYMPRVIGGRYGLSSKEFTPAMAKGVFDHLSHPGAGGLKNSFTIGINDDVTHLSLPYDESYDIEDPAATRAVFWGLGADGTVGANKNSIKIIADNTELQAQGYFVYDSKKSGARTVSHLRFGPNLIKSPSLVQRASFVGVHQFSLVDRYDTLGAADKEAVVLFNAPYAPDQLWAHLPSRVQQQIIDRKLRVYTIDAYRIARENHLGVRINTIMQTCFFALSGVIQPVEEAIAKIKDAIYKTYKKRGDAVVKMNMASVDVTLENLHRVTVPDRVTAPELAAHGLASEMPEFVREVTLRILTGDGDRLPVSAFPVDGTFPVGTTKYEKSNIGSEIPVWEPDICIQCGKCVMVCPHAVIRSKLVDSSVLASKPEGFREVEAKWRELPNTRFTIQVSGEDCTGCGLCVEVCPAKDKSNISRRAINMTPFLPIRERTIEHWDFFQNLAQAAGVAALEPSNVKNLSLREPLFEFSGACAACGETPYVKLMSQLFGDRAVIANATGCSSIYGGNLPTTPYTTNAAGHGPAWANSLFEDNAEFGLGMRVSLDKQLTDARALLTQLRSQVGEALADEILAADQSTDEGIARQRERVEQLRKVLSTLKGSDSRVANLESLSGALVKKSVWILGGDGWAYDIGYGGLDHVLANTYNVNILVLDTEVYSNTGGQASKSTSLGAVAKFAMSGKSTPKKNLGLLAMGYGHVYVAQVALGSSDVQTLKAFREAEAWDGPSLIIAYSHCVAHGINMTKGFDQQKAAVNSGHWPLFRYNPALKSEGKNPFTLDSKAPSIALKDYIYNETRYLMLRQSAPEVAAELLTRAEAQVKERWDQYETMAGKKA